MKNKGMTVIIVVLAVILAGLVGLLVYLESGRPEAQKPSAPETQNAAAETQGDAAETQSGAEIRETGAAGRPEHIEPTFVTQGEADATPMVPAVDPEMDPNGEDLQVDPTLGADETRDPDENELPMVG